MFSFHIGKASLNHFPSSEVDGDIIVYRLSVLISSTNLTFFPFKGTLGWILGFCR